MKFDFLGKKGIYILANGPLPKGFLRNPIHFVAFGFGSGCSPIAPGTIGTLVAVPLYLLIQDLSLIAYAVMLVLTFSLGVWLCANTSQALGVHDHGGIVWDEFVGYWITMFAAPSPWYWCVIGFLLFRIFDIWKPFPISWLDKKVHGGLGIMIDDVLAGVFALVCLQILATLFLIVTS